MNNQKRKVLILDRQLYFGGGETYKLDIARILKKKGFDITFSSPAEGKFFHRVKELGYSFTPYTPKSRTDIPGMIRYARAQKKGKYDIIITSDSDSWYSGIFLKIFCRPKVIFAVVHISTLGTEKKFGFFKRKVISYVDRMWAHFHTTVVCSTNHHANILFNEGIKQEKLLVIPNTVNREQILKNTSKQRQKDIKKSLAIPEDSLILSMFGRFGAGKDFNNLIDAIPEVIKEQNNVVFLLVGDGPNLQIMKDKAKELGISDKIRFPGFIKEEYYDYLDLADIFINSTIAEGVSYVVLDAMALGKPIVATSSGGIKEAVKHNENGLLVQPGNPAELSEGINILLKNKEKMKLFSKNAVKLQENHFSFDRMKILLFEYFGKYLHDFK